MSRSQGRKSRVQGTEGTQVYDPHFPFSLPYLPTRFSSLPLNLTNQKPPPDQSKHAYLIQDHRPDLPRTYHTNIHIVQKTCMLQHPSGMQQLLLLHHNTFPSNVLDSLESGGTSTLYVLHFLYIIAFCARVVGRMV
jgi:hypothetical protein